jgi:hypothetical protein
LRAGAAWTTRQTKSKYTASQAANVPIEHFLRDESGICVSGEVFICDVISLLILNCTRFVRRLFVSREKIVKEL